MVEYVVLGILLILLIIIFANFHPARTAKITDGLYAVNCLYVNFYAYVSGEEIALFDTGFNPATARRGLAKLGLSPEKVTRVFFTHTDFDHTGGLSAFPNAAVYICEDEEQMISGKTARRGVILNRIARAHKTMKDGEEVKHGGALIKLLHTPGHTPGSASYLIDGRALVTGDLLRVTSTGKIKPFLRLMNMNHERDAKSVAAISDTIDKAEFILSGHTGVKKKG